MELRTYFDDFRKNTQPTEHQRKIMIAEHTRLRELLAADETLKPILMATFIQGSQRRATAIRGSIEHPSDVDVVAVMKFARDRTTAKAAHEIFLPFLERHYRGRFKPHDRSWCIVVDDQVTLDLVPTAEPDSPTMRAILDHLNRWNPSGDSIDYVEAAIAEAKSVRGWDQEKPLWIPDRTLHQWEQTHPLFLIDWTAQKNGRCNGYFTHVVKAAKWWKREMQPDPKYPKGYPLEHIVAECCPDGISSVADGLTRSLENIVTRFQADAMSLRTPYLGSRGVDGVNVMRRVESGDFARFHARVSDAARLARRALTSEDIGESARLWRQLLGPQFPPGPEPAFTPRTEPTRLAGGRYA